MENEAPYVSIYPCFGGYTIRAGEGLYCTADLDHVLRIVHASLTEIDENDQHDIDQAVKRSPRKRQA